MSALCGPGCGYCGMCSAAWEREEHEEEADTLPMSVRVVTRRDGYKGLTFIGYTADSFERGQLIISSLSNNDEHVFGPAEWLDAVAYDERGNVLFDIVNPTQEGSAA